ncbi:GPN-loop GTPase 1 [Stylophora pistillata]|uniref:GPN-loop GTPase n=1 Tax=Stylophora pistillata TaxID=50429 RepID=A0A2B4SSJ5_STYPI|nr:GPN-loop GTPase 1 [Stylophora pistillata]
MAEASGGENISSTSATASIDRTDQAASEDSFKGKPTCILCLGMAGSGKTTFVQRLTAHLYAQKETPYVVNLDPAVKEVPYPANIDIRDSVNYKEVMKQYKLGPNGGIVTSLNLFATRFDQTDIVDHNFAVEWMQDFEAFEEALSQDTTYMSSFSRSMSLVLDEFYQNLRTVGVSSMTGAGFEEFLKAVDDAVVEFETQYKPEYERLKNEKEEKAKKDREDQLRKVQQDLGKGKPVAMETVKTGAQAIESAHETPFHISLGADLDSDDDDDEKGDDEEWDEEEMKEHESFKRFLEKEKQKEQHAKKEESD